MVRKKQNRKRIISISAMEENAIIYYRGKDKQITYSMVYKNINRLVSKFLRNKLYISIKPAVNTNKIIFLSILDLIEHLNISPFQYIDIMKVQDSLSGEVLEVLSKDSVSFQAISDVVKNSSTYKKLSADKQLLFEIKTL